MDLRHLRYFVWVAEELHFGRAAARLGISQPPLSQQIRALEEDLCVRLFERTSRRVQLTVAGEQFLPEARATLAQADQAILAARRAGRGDVGHLSLAFSTSVPFIPRVVSAISGFQREKPDVRLNLQEIPRDAQFEGIARGEIDLGLVRSLIVPSLPPGVVAQCLMRESLSLAMRSDHPLAGRSEDPGIAELEGEPLIIYSGSRAGGFSDHLLEMCRQAGFVANVVLEVQSLATLLGLTAAGFGVTVVSASLARLSVDTLAFRRFDVPVTSDLWMVHKAALSPTASRFREMLMGPG